MGQGPPGNIGDQGLPGPSGDKGPKGPKGPLGDIDPSLSIDYDQLISKLNLSNNIDRITKNMLSNQDKITSSLAQIIINNTNMSNIIKSNVYDSDTFINNIVSKLIKNDDYRNKLVGKKGSSGNIDYEDLSTTILSTDENLTKISNEWLTSSNINSGRISSKNLENIISNAMKNNTIFAKNIATELVNDTRNLVPKIKGNKGTSDSYDIKVYKYNLFDTAIQQGKNPATIWCENNNCLLPKNAKNILLSNDGDINLEKGVISSSNDIIINGNVSSTNDIKILKQLKSVNNIQMRAWNINNGASDRLYFSCNSKDTWFEGDRGIINTGGIKIGDWKIIPDGSKLKFLYNDNEKASIRKNNDISINSRDIGTNGYVQIGPWWMSSPSDNSNKLQINKDGYGIHTEFGAGWDIQDAVRFYRRNNTNRYTYVNTRSGSGKGFSGWVG